MKILDPKIVKAHKYPINVLKECYGNKLSKKKLFSSNASSKSSLKSNYLIEQIFEVLICPYVNMNQHKYLQYYYKDNMTFLQIAEKEGKDESDIKEEIENAILILRNHFEIVFILYESPKEFSSRIREINDTHYGRGCYLGFEVGQKVGYEDGLMQGYGEGQKKSYKERTDKITEEAYQKGYNDGYQAGQKDFGTSIVEEKLVLLTIDELPEISVEELQLSSRSYNCLKRAGINSLKELVALEPKQLLEIKNLGKNTAMEIIEAIKKFGIDTSIYNI